MREIFEEHKKIVFICASLLLIAILLFIIQKIVVGKEHHKIEKGNDYVYTIDTYTSNKGKTSYLPIINLDFNTIEEYNQNIKEAYEASIQIEENMVTYQYTVSKNILFLLIKFSYLDIETDELETIYRSFNIDLKNGKLLQNEELLKRWNYTKEDVSNTILKTLKNYYRKGSEKKYIDDKMCNFSCFLYNHLIEEKNLTKNVSLYFEKGDLIIYKPFLLNSVLMDKRVFPVDAFQMKITKES